MSAVKKLNIVDIENGLEALAQQKLSQAEYGKGLIALFAPVATTRRLGTAKANTSDFENGILWREKMHYVPCKAGELNAVIEAVKSSDKTLKAKVRLVVVNDGLNILVFDRKYNELTDCTIETVKDEPQLFLPLTGQEGFRREEENEVDIKATGKLAKLYDALIENNPDWLEGSKRHALNHFMTQIIFCLFAEDTSILPKDIFTKTLKNRAGSNGEDATKVISDIYSVLDLNDTQRTETAAWLKEFPYVNGGLFSGEVLVPKFTPKAYRYLLEASSLDWKHINPDILGSSIQAIVDPTMRGNLGMHYTSVPNILKTLEPLFLNELRDELFKARHSKKLINLFLERLSKIVLFDPACGSGNFLVIAYRELRKLELQAMDALRDLEGGASMAFGFNSVISLSNFYGIEYADFAAETAKLALWIAEYQQNARFIAAFGADIPALPLNDSSKILCANSLRISWEEFCHPQENIEVYVVSNPPYLGARDMGIEQKQDLKFVFEGILPGYNNLDYVAGWFYLGAIYCKKVNGKFAFVCTNTLVQGVHVGKLWPYILKLRLEIFFAHKPFKWSNNAAKNAGVSCVIIGMRTESEKEKYIFEGSSRKKVEFINSYLLPMDSIFIKEKSEPQSKLPTMTFGNMPNDGGSLILSHEEASALRDEYPESKKFIKLFIGSNELIKGLRRYCLWIEDNSVDEALLIPFIKSRMESCKQSRETSKRLATKKLAAKPHKFGEVRYKKSDSVIAVSSVSSEKREYLPVVYLSNGEIISNLAFAIYDAPLWCFSILVSKLHVVWVKAICGQLETRIRYSNTLGWNNFPIPDFSNSQLELLSQSARNIILAREEHFPKSIAELYDIEKMPNNLKEAHAENDALLENFYRKSIFETDEDRLAHLFERYVEMTKGSEQ